jgi:D-alanyl-D-alanine carboxypeptidase
MTKAVIAVANHPVLSVAATAESWELQPTEGRVRTLGSTDRLATRDDVEVLAAKTGYTDTAGYCFSAVIRTKGGRTIALSLLGSPSTATRWRDVEKVLQATR